jgi:uncharacterized membrane protein
MLSLLHRKYYKTFNKLITSMKSPFNQYQLDEMRKDPNNYKWGIFYFNRLDPRTIVPKRNIGMGWTLNFANPYSYLFLAGIILVPLIIGYLF